MNEVQIFNNPIFGELPIIEINGKEYFGATDAAKSLSFSNQRDAIKTYVDEDGVVVHDVIDNLGRKQSKKFVTEAGLYALIFGAARQGNNKKIKELAKKFQKWVFEEVLPSIRKTGGYQMQPQYNIPQTLPEALRLSADLAEQNAELKPKAELHDKFIATAGAINLTAASKELNVKRNDLVDKLLNHGYIYRTKGHRGILQPMKKYVPKLFVLKSGGYDPDGIEFTPQMLITPYGREVIYKKFYAPDQTELDMEAM
ncbi:phage antirepressor KilAC domain-containing protein [Weissella koreensis]|uniref:phage antirepressor KilAC domain-containing protein n=1 Tax=Weissella koreensis TaxID=165096 RepID=UPI0022BA6FE2|nr:phage antirepressor KilAC domain-containing protein [Weissella koreensis]MCZ9310647.1 phage antirepressor KilAC domain-containing protein [Weissella koreensis]